MSPNKKLLLNLLTFLVGWFLMGVGYTIKLGHPLNTICFLLGFTFIIIGIIFFIIIIKEK